jgi:hypothetical protein
MGLKLTNGRKWQGYADDRFVVFALELETMRLPQKNIQFSFDSDFNIVTVRMIKIRAKHQR